MTALDPTAHIFYFQHEYFIKYMNESGFKLIETYPSCSEKFIFNKTGILRSIFVIFFKLFYGLNLQINNSYIFRKYKF